MRAETVNASLPYTGTSWKASDPTQPLNVADWLSQIASAVRRHSWRNACLRDGVPHHADSLGASNWTGNMYVYAHTHCEWVHGRHHSCL